MKRIVCSTVSVLISLIMLSCSGGTSSQQATSTTPCPDNGIPEGGEWITMFDGKTLNGWRGYGKKEVPGGWKVEDGIITFSAISATSMEGADLIYDRKFKNFVFEIEWRVGKAGNSGIFYTAQEIEGKPIYYSSPEYQLLDNVNMPDAWEGVGGNRQAGAVYDMIPPIPQSCNPYDTWNKTRIVVYNMRVIHYLNDVQILEYQLGTPVWKALVDKSKFGIASNDPEKEPAAYELMLNAGKEPGYIGLQDHGYGLAFRNIRIKEL
ncbi:hypothetical protein M2459_002539 [Parabacteroides sp. PF5-5]|uniref:3-keto-disaccharide hydrolase n=1 Tax=unclassified Parabacteroides TaxID=2649774 RepID=UPI002474BB14|nr:MULTISPECIES: DUF1080 domain-containing protein [unclassified Parabacteroides]MDH6305705.1 hypothetical protein [Parabacteroides sp. PH5-39]MDH6316777.1 hypothetical protein [Parabacteroides sp. PF5-13]MDH6320418.1 hypothetical protein [Parabacteroides sp. PH5-13]MDH6324148.1 hypothetical protein [Parabacteroides sp. PH5-8]MDH6327963.1 hypothetical protein [Parabacteroides sp. PH5-41]